MKRAFVLVAVLALLWAPATAQPAQPGEPLDGLARQIAEINANIANLGRNNAAALRYLTASLTAYRRAWAELTRHQVDLGDDAGHTTVVALAAARP